jgi:hypothetical protein
MRIKVGDKCIVFKGYEPIESNLGFATVTQCFEHRCIVRLNECGTRYTSFYPCAWQDNMTTAVPIQNAFLKSLDLPSKYVVYSEDAAMVWLKQACRWEYYNFHAEYLIQNFFRNQGELK